MSDVSSAGMAGVAPGYGKTCRQDVLRGIDIPVMPGTAGRARPVPRIFKPSAARRYPHAEHIFDDGNHRSITITRRPYRAALY